MKAARHENSNRGLNMSLPFGNPNHAFHEDAEPGDLGLQLPTRSFNSSKKFWTTTTLELSPIDAEEAERPMRNC